MFGQLQRFAKCSSRLHGYIIVIISSLRFMLHHPFSLRRSCQSPPRFAYEAASNRGKMCASAPSTPSGPSSDSPGVFAPAEQSRKRMRCVEADR